MPSYSQDDYNTLCKAIAQGALSVKYADKEVMYRNLKEMLQIKAMMADDLGLNGTNPQSNGRRYATFSKGI